MKWHQEYKEKYARLKKEGVPFFPDVLFNDAVVAVLVFAALCALALLKGSALEELADPTDTTYNPRPEWYFLFLFEALKFFPGNMEAVAAVVMPAVGIGILVLLPFIDRGPERHPLDRPLITGLGIAGICGVLYLSWAGARSPLLNPMVDKDPKAIAGQRLYFDLKCSYCHSIGGKGGKVGPDLVKAADNESEEWLTKHFKDPQAMTKGSIMPKMNLLDDEVASLVAYVKSLGAGAGFTPDAPKLFVENCAVCHKIGKNGGEVGPDLSLIGTARDASFLRKYITDPAKSNAASTMPAFGGQLTETQIEDLARYLAHQGRD